MHTLATFEKNLTSVITTIFVQQNHQRTIERAEAAAAEAKREEQRKADTIIREQQHRDEVQQIEKLEVRRDKERAADRAANQLQSQQLMMQMMQRMFPQTSTQQQQMPGMTQLQFPITSPPASEQPAITPTSVSQSDANELAVTMDKTKLSTEESVKKQKTLDRMNLEHKNNHPQLPLPHGSQH